MQSSESHLPAYIHIVLDGHIGIGGIPRDVPGGEEFSNETKTFFAKNGFSTFDNAYSRYIATINSMRNLFDFTNSNKNWVVERRNARVVASTLDKPLYFRLLSDQGYSLRIFQPDYIDYCSANYEWISYCRHYPNINLKSIENSDFTIEEKATLMLHTLLLQSELAKGYYRSLKNRFDLPVLQARRVPAVNQGLIDAVVNDVQSHPRGYAYIMHLIAPHAPLAYDADCIIQTQRTYVDTQVQDPFVTWTLVDEKLSVLRAADFEQTRSLRYSRYFEQVKCVTNWLEQLFSALKAINAYDDATIILHSDHGSQIGTLSPREVWQHEMTETDYVDAYSSLFAIKNGRPGFQNNSFLSLQEILANVMEELFSTPIDVYRGLEFVYMQSDEHPAILDKVPVKNFIQSGRRSIE